MKKYLIIASMFFLGAYVSNNTNQQDKHELIGTWAGSGDDSVAALTVIGEGYASYLVVPSDQKPFSGSEPTEAELAEAFKSSDAATLEFDLVKPGRWRMKFINSLNPSYKGVEVYYDYEWMSQDKKRMQYWVLDGDMERTNETGFSVRLD